MFIQLLAIIVIAIVYRYIYKPWKKCKLQIKQFEDNGYKVYKFPYNPIGAQLFRFFQKNYQTNNDSFYTLKRMQQYDVITSNFLGSPMIQIINTKLLKQFFDPNKLSIYHKSKLLHKNFIKILGNGIFFSEDNKWKDKRKVLTHIFNFDFIKKLIPLILKRIDQSLQLIEEQRQVLLAQKTSVCFGQIISEMFFGSQIPLKDQHGESLSELLKEILRKNGEITQTLQALILGQLIYKLTFVPKIKKHNELLERYNKKVIQIIRIKVKNMQNSKERKQLMKQTHDVVNQVIKYNQTCKDDQKYKIEDLLGQFNNLFFAGIQTSSRLSEMMITYISLYPHIKEKAMDEIQKFIKTDQDYNHQNLKKLVYLEAISRQTLRFYGPGTGTLIRQVLEDHKLQNVPIFKGALLGAMFYPNFFNQKFYKNPFEFCPERWIQGDFKDQDPYVELNFSAGPKTCIGKQLALLETKIFVTKFLKRFSNFKQKNSELKFRMMPMYAVVNNIIVIEKKEE